MKMDEKRTYCEIKGMNKGKNVKKWKIIMFFYYNSER